MPDGPRGEERECVCDLFKRETDGRVLEARTGNAGEATMAKSATTVRSAAMMQ